jgi:hypothetical protein
MNRYSALCGSFKFNMYKQWLLVISSFYCYCIYNMDVSYERNITTLLTTIISNMITMVLLGIFMEIKEDYNDKALLKQKDDIYSYAASFFVLLGAPLEFVWYTAKALCCLIKGMSVGMPYKYIRLLSNARYFVSFTSQDKLFLYRGFGK